VTSVKFVGGISKFRCRILRLGFILIGLTACTTLPESGITDDVNLDVLPKNWSTLVVHDKSQKEFWISFGDPDLARTVTKVVELNAGLSRQNAEVTQARLQSLLSGTNRLPSVDIGVFPAVNRSNLEGTTTEVLVDDANSNEILSFTTTNITAGLSVSWEVDFWNRLKNDQKASVQNYLSSVEGLRVARLTVAGLAAKRWLDVSEANELAKVSEEAIALFQQTVEIVEGQAAQGIASPNEVRRATANLTIAEARLSQDRRSVDLALRELQVLARQWPDGRRTMPEKLPELPYISADLLPAQLLEHRPDIKAAALQLSSLIYAARSSRRARYPTFRIDGFLGRSTSSFSDLLGSEFSIWSIAGNLIQPVFDGGRIKLNIKSADAAVEAAAEQYVDVVLQAALDIESGLAADEFLKDESTKICAAADLLDASARIALNRYEYGISNFLPVLETQRQVSDAKRTCIASRRRLLDNRIDLHLSLGGQLPT